jgi:hypothetical protein
MCVPEISIRPDGGIDWEVDQHNGVFYARLPGEFWWKGTGDLVMEAVDNALAKVRATEHKGSLESVGLGATVLEAVNDVLAKVRAASPQGDGAK